MKYWTRSAGSQRSSTTLQAYFEPNYVGQGGSNKLIFRLPTGKYMVFEPETMDEVRELQSQAAILAHNFREPRNG